MLQNSKHHFESVVGHLIGTDDDPLCKVNVSSQFDPDDTTTDGVVRNLNATFLIVLSGQSHPLYETAHRYLNSVKNLGPVEDIRNFFNTGLTLIQNEINSGSSGDVTFAERLGELCGLLSHRKNTGRMALIEKVRGVFFPEGVGICRKKEEMIRELREKRKITVTHLNPDPITSPHKEILFTSNVLITLPPPSKNIRELPLSDPLKRRIEDVVREDQLFWYDHPVQIGVETGKNEAIYGLRGLDDAIIFEIDRGTIPQDAMVDCVLSVSTTHRGLQGLTMDYLEEEIAKEKGIDHLNIYLFNESDTRRFVDTILQPAAQHYMEKCNGAILHDIIGVDGEYGRHYSFLKAIAAFWQVFINPGIRATFKMDLDQVFPQKQLLEHTGMSAFEHFKTPLWGAEGTEIGGGRIELGMIAGALVNEKDIPESLFFPDVCFPPEEIKGDELVFQSALPQALSTEAEMMARYPCATCNGTDNCIQRFHVTGGTCGILVDSLRRYRPFTPTFIGRAEDQAYVLSVLFAHQERNLRYVHKDGLIMRHDKEAFAKESIRTAAIGKLVGDYTRILLFSHYVRALPWSYEKTKALIDPFTGCFVSLIPITIVYLRLALKAATLFSSQSAKKHPQGVELLNMGTRRLGKLIDRLTGDQHVLREQFRREKEGWDIFYDILDHVEKGLNDKDPFAEELRERACKLAAECKLNF